jgi:hypothetical protein
MKYVAFILAVIFAFSCNSRSDLSTIVKETTIKTSFKQVMADRETHYRLYYDENEILDTKRSEVWCDGDPKDCLPTVVVTPNNIAYYNEFTDSIQNNNHWDYFTTGNYMDLLDTLSTAIYNDFVSVSNHFIKVEFIAGNPFYTLVDTSITISNFSASDAIWVVPVNE